MESEVSEVERRIQALYGVRALAMRGVVHVAAAMRSAGRLHLLRIGEGAPKSATDFFILNLCRARCDAILTTAANLRAEPGLRHDLQGEAAAMLAAYRRLALGREGAPWCAILTRSGDLPVEHPVWGDWTEKVVLRSDGGEAGAVESGARVRTVVLPELDARSACAYLRSEGRELVSVEAGASVAGALYGADSPVDELLLTLYEGPRTDVPLAGVLPADEVLFAERECTADSVRDEAGGRFRFQRWVRNTR